MTVTEAARRLGISPRRVQRLCADGRLPAEKWGRDWRIKEPLVDPRRPTGRPRHCCVSRE